jgi:hypothetical protein
MAMRALTCGNWEEGQDFAPPSLASRLERNRTGRDAL